MFNKFKKIKAFTILELTIVIVIIGVLMAATMRFGGDRISLLTHKNIQEQFLANYSDLYSHNNMTNYYMGKMYQSLDIIFEIGKEDFGYKYNLYDSIYTGGTKVDGGYYKINKLSLDGAEVEIANISMKPYTLGCSIEKNSNELEIGILVNNSKQYCFLLNSDTCRIRNISCNY